MQKQQLSDLITKIRRSRKPISTEKKDQIIQMRDSLKAKEEKAYELLAEAELKLTEIRNARIQVRNNCFPGSQIEIDEDVFSPRNDLGRVTFYLRDGEISMR